MNKRTIAILVASACLWSFLVAAAKADGARNYISIVGSTTVQPFSLAVAEQIGKSHKVKAPMIESTGTGGGITLFCEGIGMAYPDIVNASRPMRQSEFDHCRDNGVKDVLEIKFGLGAVVAIQASGATLPELSRKDLFLALAKRIPDPTCKSPCEKLVVNPNHSWKQVNSTLPDQPIQVFGPPASSGTSETFMELAMDVGCDSYPWLAARKNMNELEHKRICHAVREDGVYTEDTGESVLSRVAGQSNSVGLVSYSGYQNSRDTLKAIAIEQVRPDAQTLISQTYPLTRPLLFYVKKAHMDRVPGLNQYLAEFSSEKAWGPKGYLAKKGLVSMTASERAGYAQIARDLKPMVAAGQLLPVLMSPSEDQVIEPAAKVTSRKASTSKPVSKKKRQK